MKRKTQSEIDEILKEKNIEQLGEYVNSYTPMEVKCLICGHIWSGYINNIKKSKIGCPYCRDYTLSFEEVNRRLEESERTVRLIGEYYGMLKHTTFKCLICNHEWPATPNNVVNHNRGCPICGGSSPLSFEEVNRRLKESERTVRLIGKYTNNKTRTLFNCLMCDYNWNTTPKKVLCGTGCPCCGDTTLSFEEVNRRLKESNRSIKLVGEYINSQTRTLFNCLICNYNWNATPGAVLIRETGCPCCAKSGFKPEKPAYLYYIKILHDGWYYYKIGITNNSIEKRFCKTDIFKIEEIIFEEYFDTGKRAYEKEQFLLNYFNNYRYSGPKILKSGGNSEIFTYDVLKEHFVY